MGLRIRSYRINSTLAPDEINAYGSYPGTREDKARAYFRISRARQLLRELSIGYRIHVTSTDFGLPSEVIMQMNEHEYALWRIAGGDHWCTVNPSMNVNRLDNPASVENEVAAALGMGWQIDFFDGTVNFIRGDAMVSVYEDGAVRGVCGPHVLFFYPDGSCNTRGALLRFPFITNDNIAPPRNGQ